MTFSKTFIVFYKTNLDHLSYSITGLIKNFEFLLDSKKISRLTSEDGLDLIECKQISSWWNSDIEINFRDDPKANKFKFFKDGSSKGYRLQGLYKNKEIDWDWKFDPETISFELIDVEENNRVLADIVDFTLKKKSRGKLRITGSLDCELEYLILVTSCLIWSY